MNGTCETITSMCELFCLSSRVPTVVSISLQRFAARGGLDGRALDGWGLAFYDGRDVRAYREPEPARDSAWLPFIEQRRVPSTLVLSHIRRATQGKVTLANTQPFMRELGGRVHSFAHNGKLPEIETAYRRDLRRFHPIGETDSEVAACLLFERLADLWDDSQPPSLEARIAVIDAFAADMRRLGPANFLYADADTLFAHSHRRTQADGSIAPPGLWRLHRRCSVDHDALPAAGIELTAAPEGQEMVLLASVPLTSEDWQPLREGEALAIRNGAIVSSSGVGNG